MYERFSPETAAAIRLAKVIAANAGSAAVLSEHLLLGLALRDPAMGASLPGNMTDPASLPSPEPPFSPEAQRILAYCAAESERCLRSQALPSDLIVGILKEPSCAAAQWLQAHGISPSHIRPNAGDSRRSES